MMKRILLALTLLAMLATTTAFAPLQKTQEFLIHNNREIPMKIVFKGPKDYTFTLAPGWHERTIEEGDYTITYEGCVADVEVTMTIDEPGQYIEIPYCPTPPELTKFVISSHFGTKVEVTFTAHDDVYGKDYTFAAELGRNRYEFIQSGWYDYSYDACDTTFSGTIRIEKAGTTDLLLKSCEALARQELVSAGVTNFKLHNHYTTPIVVTLIGSRTYFYTLEPGTTPVEMLSGTYTYIYAIGGIRYEGQIFVSKTGTSSAKFPNPSPPRAGQ